MKYRLIKTEDLDKLYDFMQTLFHSKLETPRIINSIDFTEIVAQYDLGTGCRKAHYVKIRMFLREILCSNTKLTYQHIAEMTGCADHSTISYSRKHLRHLFRTQPELKTEFETFEIDFWKRVEANAGKGISQESPVQAHLLIPNLVV